jgi:Outer membrane protein beta-barrel domain
VSYFSFHIYFIIILFKKSIMKKIMLLATAAFFATQAVAQDKKFVLGLGISPIATWFTTPNDNSISSGGAALGVGFGVYGDYYFAENYALTAGINFSLNQGGTLNYSKGGQLLAKSELSNVGLNGAYWNGDNAITYKNQYLEIPIGLKLHTEEVDGLRFFGNLPIVTLGVRTQSQANIKGSVGTTAYDLKDENIGKDMALFNVSIGGGLGAEYRLGEHNTVFAGLFYQHGLIDQTNNFKRLTLSGTTVTEEAEKSNAQLSGVSLRVGVNF